MKMRREEYLPFQKRDVTGNTISSQISAYAKGILLCRPSQRPYYAVVLSIKINSEGFFPNHKVDEEVDQRTSTKL